MVAAIRTSSQRKRHQRDHHDMVYCLPSLPRFVETARPSVGLDKINRVLLWLLARVARRVQAQLLPSRLAKFEHLVDGVIQDFIELRGSLVLPVAQLRFQWFELALKAL